MKSFDFTIRDEVGIHARPAGMLVNTAKSLSSKITIKKGERTADAKKLFSVMSLGAKKGDTVTVICEGGGEDGDIEAMRVFFEANL